VNRKRIRLLEELKGKLELVTIKSHKKGELNLTKKLLEVEKYVEQLINMERKTHG